jgi:hypothetical protein
MRLDHLIDGDQPAFVPGTAQHCDQSIVQRTIYVQYSDSFSGHQGLIDQLSCMNRVAEGGVEDTLCASMRPREFDRCAFSYRIATSGENDAVPAFRRLFQQHSAEQLVSDPGRGGMDGYPIPCAIRIVFVEERGGIVGVENVAKASRVFGEVALLVAVEFTKDEFSDQLRVWIQH